MLYIYTVDQSSSIVTTAVKETSTHLVCYINLWSVMNIFKDPVDITFVDIEGILYINVIY